MKRVYEALLGLGLVTTAAVGATACGGSAHKAEQSPATTQPSVQPIGGLACTGLEFVTPKGDRGDIQIDAYPKFNRNLGDPGLITVTGVVASGNDAGESLQQGTDGPYGSFQFTWNPATKTLQRSVVDATVTIDGYSYPCQPTTVTFNPSTYEVSPHLPSSPF